MKEVSKSLIKIFIFKAHVVIAVKSILSRISRAHVLKEEWFCKKQER